MIDRYNAFLVILEHDQRSDDAEATLGAIRQIKGVLKVTPHIAEVSDAIAYSRVRSELVGKLFEVIYGKTKGSTE